MNLMEHKKLQTGVAIIIAVLVVAYFFLLG